MEKKYINCTSNGGLKIAICAALIFLFLPFSEIIAQGIKAEYENVYCFSNYSKPTIGLLKIEGFRGIEEQIYEALKIDYGWRGKFKFFPFKTLQSQKNSLGISSLDAEDQEVLSALKYNAELQIDFVLTGKENENGEFEISIINTENGNSIYDNNYKYSTNSNPVADLLKLFSDSKRTVYKEIVKENIFSTTKIDGYYFKTVKIGSQIWLAQNLNVDHFRNGEKIPEISSEEEWNATIENKQPGWCYYQNDRQYGNKYGKLYNWFAVNDPRGLAPKGWHIPTLAEFQMLIEAVKMHGNELKEIGQGIGSGEGTNLSGFTALLAGSRLYKGAFGNVREQASFWTSSIYKSTSAYSILLYGGDNAIGFLGTNNERGFSVRCVKD